MAQESSTKKIERNRPPRVHIEYVLETYGAQKKIQLPFVMGVLADLAGKPDKDHPLPPVEKREFLDITGMNFDARMKGVRPRVAFNVKNVTIDEKSRTDENDQLAVDLVFESLDGFSPAAVASKVKGLSDLFAQRTELANLLIFMDGKADAQALLSRVIQNDAVLKALAAAGAGQEETGSTGQPANG